MENNRRTIRKKHQRQFKIGVTILVLLVTVWGLWFYFVKSDDGLRNPLTYHRQVELTVPYENQLKDQPALKNGCEVTSLAMLLRYYGYNVNKNVLAKKIDCVPFNVDRHHHGDPHDGFVGNMTSGYAAMGAYVEPVSKLCKQIVGSDYTVHSGEKLELKDLERLIHHGHPVWILATLDFQPVTKKDLINWKTPNGIITVTPLIHSVVVTGINQKDFYVNDPLKKANRKVPIAKLAKSFAGLRSQYLYLMPK
ncbi:C39 family peptidase [Bombilactobacillus folatiphilus]|uniref:C39 family peptidase n=1 Tax=Bombilactobacillus folatiphilus TaxID=2923362 RepID=A0ABY4P9A4_9LACO|nr:C39 family peptidase [Bombilactobacillus folatiphilus]UQS82323.1 C39 family peptidase [Bombilactobacillus folatiphilus]